MKNFITKLEYATIEWGLLVEKLILSTCCCLARETIFRAITSAPAEIFEIDGAGSLEAGGLGDLVIWDGDPLEVMSAPTAVYIGGVEQSLESRQTRLRDRYLSLDESEKPLAFKH